MKEIWRPIEGFSRYEVSNFGKVKCQDYMTQSRSVNGNAYKKRVNGKVLAERTKDNGYVYTCIVDDSLVPKTVHVHRLVAKAFIPNPENKPFINHIDNIRANNFVSNLEWCTRRENINHMLKQNRQAFGERAGSSKLKVKDVLFIRESKLKREELSKMFGINKCYIRNIKKKITWKNI